MPAAFDRADGDGVNHQPRFKAGLDREQASDASQHCHWLSKHCANGEVPPFVD
jgi:hypothetical protein